MYENIKIVLMCIGAMSVLCFLFLCMFILKDFISSLIDNAKWKYEYKHRFDKPPLAKCYCIDCQYYNKNRESCSSLNGWCVTDNSFCWCAEPKKAVSKQNKSTSIEE